MWGNWFRAWILNPPESTEWLDGAVRVERIRSQRPVTRHSNRKQIACTEAWRRHAPEPASAFRASAINNRLVHESPSKYTTPGHQIPDVSTFWMANDGVNLTSLSVTRLHGHGSSCIAFSVALRNSLWNGLIEDRIQKRAASSGLFTSTNQQHRYRAPLKHEENLLRSIVL